MFFDYAANFRQFYLFLWKNFVLQVSQYSKVVEWVTNSDYRLVDPAPDRHSIRVDDTAPCRGTGHHSKVSRMHC